MTAGQGARPVFLSILGFLGLLAASPARAQDLSGLIGACGGASDLQLAWCQEMTLAVQAAQGAMGLAASGGTDLPGSASTLGWRLKGSPRIALSARGFLVRARFPALQQTNGFPRGSRGDDLPSLHLVGTVGLFDGFSLGPTAGGFLSADFTVSGQWIRTPREQGFQDDAKSWGIGARVGLLRESFSLPGISLSASHRFLGSHDLLSLAEGEPGEASFDLGVSSLRGVLGKDLFGIGFFGGVGWDRYRGDMELVVRNPHGGPEDAEVAGKLRSDRRLYFFGASLTFLALQISGEVGWAQGFSPVLVTLNEGGFDPSSRSEFAALALRLTF